MQGNGYELSFSQQQVFGSSGTRSLQVNKIYKIYNNQKIEIAYKITDTAGQVQYVNFSGLRRINCHPI